MFARTLKLEIIGTAEVRDPVPLKWLDSFAMRNFTNDTAFDDTLPLSDGLMEAGNRVSPVALRAAMEDWFRRKGWLTSQEKLTVCDE